MCHARDKDAREGVEPEELKLVSHIQPRKLELQKWAIIDLSRIIRTCVPSQRTNKTMPIRGVTRENGSTSGSSEKYQMKY